MSFLQRNMHNLTLKLTVIFCLVFYQKVLWNKQYSIVFLFNIFLCHDFTAFQCEFYAHFLQCTHGQSEKYTWNISLYILYFVAGGIRFKPGAPLSSHLPPVCTSTEPFWGTESQTFKWRRQLWHTSCSATLFSCCFSRCLSYQPVWKEWVEKM